MGIYKILIFSQNPLFILHLF